MKIQKKYHFYAGHRNKGGGEKCGRLHGHTYQIECEFEFNQINEFGVCFLFSDIDAIVDPIIKKYDHYLLLYKNDPLALILKQSKEEYYELPFETSAENLAKHIFKEIKEKLPIKKIELAETLSSKIIYVED